MLFPEWVESQHAKKSAEAKADRAARRKTPPARYPINDLQTRTLKNLAKCSFGTGSPDKRFVRDMQNATELTVRQGLYLSQLAYKYRRQLKLTDGEASGFRNQLILDANSHTQLEQPNADQPS